MARPQKEGLDYFSVDCHLNDKEKLILAEFGLIGMGCIFRLKQKIYGENGYYTEWNNDVALVFAQDCRSSANVVKEVVSACLRRGIFHRQLYEQYQILTSEEIQLECANATERRISKKIDGRYLLIPIPKNWVDVNKNAVNVDNNSENVDRNAQRREEESKEDSFIRSIARERERDEEIDLEEAAELSDDLNSPRTYLKGIGKGVVLLSDEQIGDLLERMSLDEFDYYVGVVADSELKGHHYKKKTHYQAILDMAKKDRKIKMNKQEIQKNV